MVKILKRFGLVAAALSISALAVALINTDQVYADHNDSTCRAWGEIKVHATHRDTRTGVSGNAAGAKARLTSSHNSTKTKTTNSSGKATFSKLSCGCVAGTGPASYKVRMSGTPSGTVSGGKWSPSSRSGTLRNGHPTSVSFRYDWQSTYYRYNTSISVSGSSTTPKPGQEITVRGRVKNNGTDDGRSYDYRFRVTSGGQYLESSSSSSGSGSGLNDGSSRRHTRTYRVRDDAPHNVQIRFEFRAGNSRQEQVKPTRKVEDGGYDSSSGSTRVYNLQFELSNITVSGDDDYVTPGPDGTTLGINVHVVNSGDVTSAPASINNSGAAGGTSNGVTTILDVYRNEDRVGRQTFTGQIPYGSGGRTFEYEHTIPNSDPEDTTYCFIAYSNPTAGWSDGSSYGGAPFNNTPNPIRTSDSADDCGDESRVTTQSYFQVSRNDIHSGVAFAAANNPFTGCSPVDPTRGFISAARTGTGSDDYGSLVEYAAYALDVISRFGSAVGVGSNVSPPSFFTASPGNNDLTFANDPNDGFLGAEAYRCMSDLFVMLDKDQASAPNNTNNISLAGLFGSDDDVQVYTGDDTNARITNGNLGNANNRRLTLIVDGNVTISSDIRYQGSSSSYRSNNIAIIAKGDILIESNVEQINAMLYAIPRDGGDSGVIDTCSDHENLGTNVCGEQLTITGVVVADRLDLKRTHGGISGDRDREPAEIFRFSPEMFIRAPYFVFAPGVPTPDLQVQQLVDLPPLF
ncbi:MAG: hypothetical protein WDZ42_02030 [Candidatus Saccharimonadales bacterium]